MTSGPFAYRCKGDCPVREAKRGREAPCERITKAHTPNQHRFSRNGHLFTFAVFQHSRSNILEEKKSRRRGHWPQQRIKANLRVPAPDIGEYQSQLWRAADTLRGNIDAAEYKHVVLPLIFLKYISDAFEELHEELESKADEGMDLEEPDYYTANNVFWVPKEARWSTIQSQARQNTNGTTIDQAMTAIERDNSALRGVLPKDYGRDALDKQRLGEVIDLVSNIKVGGSGASSRCGHSDQRVSNGFRPIRPQSEQLRSVQILQTTNRFTYYLESRLPPFAFLATLDCPLLRIGREY